MTDHFIHDAPARPSIRLGRWAAPEIGSMVEATETCREEGCGATRTLRGRVFRNHGDPWGGDRYVSDVYVAVDFDGTERPDPHADGWCDECRVPTAVLFDGRVVAPTGRRSYSPSEPCKDADGNMTLAATIITGSNYPARPTWEEHSHDAG